VGTRYIHLDSVSEEDMGVYECVRKTVYPKKVIYKEVFNVLVGGRCIITVRYLKSYCNPIFYFYFTIDTNQ